ncbi:MAG: MBL fold metallo-hydrolase [Cyanobacteria bacterium]|nr:MBL fold metallo-hydrolase [Cyanobacteriota bacterium]MDA0865220.1 MBL fold metallo-hydrolase [Cyanobacteriota bacterium]
MSTPMVSAAATLPDKTGFTAQFWGVRGSIPTPGSDTVRYGGNTACVEVLAGNTRLIFDGGTGLRVLGKHLLHGQADIEAHLFFTHAHWDRIQGFPFFIPAFVPGNTFNIYGSPAPNGASIKQCLTDQMLRPNFFTPLQKMQANMQFHNIHAGTVVPLEEGLTVETIALNRHTSALGFRVSWQGHSLVYATDTEPHSRELDQNLLYLAQDADLLIYDGTYADTAYHDLNSNASIAWETGINLVKEAAIKELILFHHNPAHDDDFLDRMEMEIRQHFGNVRLAREGMILQLV